MGWFIAFLVLIALALVTNANANRQSVASKKNKDSPKYRKLLRLVGGDRHTADRLVGSYGIDKAISDIERDRRNN